MPSASNQTLHLALQALRAGCWQDYFSLVKAISDLDKREELWAELGRHHPHDLDLVATLLSLPDGKQALRYLAPAIGHTSQVSPAQVLEILKYAEATGREAGYRVPDLLKALFHSNLELAITVGNALREDDQSFSDNRWTQWASGFAQAAPRAAAQYACTMPVGNIEERMALALLLERLPHRDPAVQEALRLRQAEFTQALLQDAPTEGIDLAVHWAALCHLAEWSEPAARAVLQAAEQAERPALMALSNSLLGHSGLEFGALRTPVAQVVDLLLEKALEDEALRQGFIDGCMESLLFNANLQDIATAAIERLGTHDAPVAEQFNESFSALAEKPELLNRVLTAWLVSPTASFTAIRSVLGRFTSSRAAVGLDAGVFMAAPTNRQVAAIRRLLVLSSDGPTLCAIAGLLAESPEFQPVGVDLANRMLNAVFVEYPGATEDFLQAKLKTTPRGAPYASVYKGLHQRAKNWRKVLDALPRLNELKPTDTERLALQALRLRFGRDVQRGAEERSILGLFATKVNMAQGRRFASLFGPGANRVTPTGLVSHTVEWPTWQVSDPLGAMIRRNNILRDSR